MELLRDILIVLLAILGFLAGIILHKIGTIRKWELEDEKSK